MIEEKYLQAAMPEIGTYNTYANRNSGMRFRYIKTGDLSMYFYDDALEAFKYKGKYVTSYNWNGNSSQRKTNIITHMYADTEPQLTTESVWDWQHRLHRTHHVCDCHGSEELKKVLYAVLKGDLDMEHSAIIDFRNNVNEWNRENHAQLMKQRREKAEFEERYKEADESDTEVEEAYDIEGEIEMEVK